MNKKRFLFDKRAEVNLFNEKKFSKISKHSKSIINYYESDIDICKLVVASEINLKDYLKAEQCLKKIIANHNSDEIYYLYGNILKFQNKFYDAIDAYNKAISLNKNFSEAYNNLANTQKNINENKNAEHNYLKAIELNHLNLGPYFNLANLYRSEKRYEDAISYYQSNQIKP